MTSSPSTEPLSVSQLNQNVHQCLEYHFRGLWLKAEVGSRKDYANFMFLTLKDEYSSLRAIIWSKTLNMLKSLPEKGDEILVRGSISTPRKESSFSFIIESLEFAGDGAIRRRLIELHNQLEKEGLFARSRPLPQLPKAVGLVTSQKGAAIADFKETARMRAPQIPIYVENAAMQGNRAVQSIKEALVRVSQAPGVEVIVLTRGGGSDEDLWVFNQEDLVRFLYQSPKPIVVAIGHQIDHLLAEKVADYRAHTPTAAAELVFPNLVHLQQSIHHALAQLSQGIFKHWSIRDNQLQSMLQFFKHPYSFQNQFQRLNMLENRLHQVVSLFLQKQSKEHGTLQTRLYARSPEIRLQQTRTSYKLAQRTLLAFDPVSDLKVALEHLIDDLHLAIEARLNQFNYQSAEHMMRLDDLSPLSILSRGYSIVHHQEKILTSSQMLSIGDDVQIKLHQGELKATVTQIMHSSSKNEEDLNSSDQRD